ncbi:MAG TPA: NDP-sugar synthase [Terriglobales bacterium]|nr:NDP-sugar synthase [Terriglobales bacterium]
MHHSRSDFVIVAEDRRRCAPVGAMDVRAIILTGLNPDSADGLPPRANGLPENFSGTPFPLLPVLGRPLLHRIADRLKDAGIESVSVLHAGDGAWPLIQEAHRPDLSWKDATPGQVWRAAEELFDELVQAGAELVFVIRVGAYAEVEIDPLLQFHLDKRNHITQVTAADGPLDFFVFSASRRNDAAFLFRNRLAKMRVMSQPFFTDAYVNRLRNASDLRQLVLDSFALRTAIQPTGQQVRPGIWVGNGAKIDRSVRLVAPCYIGAHSKVRRGSLITRGSSLEHHCVIDCGTVVESSTILPFSYLGAGLDLAYSIVGSKRIVSLRHAAELEVEDESLVSVVPSSSGLRTLKHAASLLAFVPRQFIKSVFVGGRSRKRALEPECPAATFDPATVGHSVAKDHPALTPTVVAGAGVRDYGNQ